MGFEIEEIKFNFRTFFNPKTNKRKNTPFNNPFADLLGD